MTGRRRRLAGALAAVALAALSPLALAAAETGDDTLSAVRDAIRTHLPRLREHYPAGSASEIVLPDTPRGAGLRDGSELLLTLRLGNHILDDALHGEVRGGVLFLEAQQLFAALGFAIEVNAAGDRAKGWFIEPGNTVEIDVAAATATLGGETRPIGRGELAGEDGTLLMSQRLVERLFGLQLNVSYRNLTVVVESKTALPLAQALQRRDRARRIANNRIPPPQFATPHDLAAPSSVVDVQAATRFTSNDAGRDAGLSSYSIGSSTSALGGTADAFVSGDEDDPTRSVTLAFGYADPDRKLLGPLRASQFSVGDVRSVRQTQLRSGSLERGVTISNRPLGVSVESGSAVIEGNIPADWDIELYRNEVLIAFQTSDSAGRYEFTDVPVIEPDEQLRLVFYGPQGQQYEEAVPFAPLAGDFGQRLTYEASVTQQGSTLVDDLKQETRSEDDGPVRASARVGYRLDGTKGLAFGIERFEQDGAERLVAEAAFDFRLDSGSGAVRAAKDRDGGESTGLLLRQRVGATSLRLEHNFFNGFTRAGRADDDLKSDLALDATTNLAALVDGAPSLNLISGVDHAYYDTKRHDVSVSAGLGLPLGATVMSKELRLTRSYGPDVDDATSTSGLFQVYRRMPNLRLRSRLSYGLHPDLRLSESTVNLDWLYDDTFRPAFELRHNVELDRSRATAAVNWDVGYALITPRLGVDDQGAVEGTLTMRLGATRDAGGGYHLNSRPLRGAGVVMARVFLDEDEDGSFGPQDRPLPDARVTAPQIFGSAMTNDDGVALLSNLRPYTKSDFQVDTASLPDDRLMPHPGGVAVQTVPGTAVNLDLPVVRTWTVEGNVLARDLLGQLRPYAGAGIVLRQLDGPARLTAESGLDGQFVIPGVRKGLYGLVATAKEATARTVLVPGEQRLRIGAGSPPAPVNLVLADEGQIPYFSPQHQDRFSLAAATRFVPLHAAAGAATAGADAAVDHDAPPPALAHAIYLGRFESRFGLYAAWNEIRGDPDSPADLPPAWLLTDVADTRHRLFAGPAANGGAAAALCERIKTFWTRCAAVAVPRGVFTAARTSISPRL